jgi:hypothetical protein
MGGCQQRPGEDLDAAGTNESVQMLEPRCRAIGLKLLIDTAARRRPRLCTSGSPHGVTGPCGGSLAPWRYGIAESAETNAGAFGVPHPVVAS